MSRAQSVEWIRDTVLCKQMEQMRSFEAKHDNATPRQSLATVPQRPEFNKILLYPCLHISSMLWVSSVLFSKKKKKKSNLELRH